MLEKGLPSHLDFNLVLPSLTPHTAVLGLDCLSKACSHWLTTYGGGGIIPGETTPEAGLGETTAVAGVGSGSSDLTAHPMLLGPLGLAPTLSQVQVSQPSSDRLSTVIMACCNSDKSLTR